MSDSFISPLKKLVMYGTALPCQWIATTTGHFRAQFVPRYYFWAFLVYERNRGFFEEAIYSRSTTMKKSSLPPKETWNSLFWSLTTTRSFSLYTKNNIKWKVLAQNYKFSNKSISQISLCSFIKYCTTTYQDK